MGHLGFSWGAKRNVESLFVSAIDSLTFWPPGASGRSWALPRPRRPHLRYPPRVGWNHVFLRVQATPEVSNMVVPRWNHVFLRVQATPEVSNMAVPSWNHVFSRVQARQGGI